MSYLFGAPIDQFSQRLHGIGQGRGLFAKPRWGHGVKYGASVSTKKLPCAPGISNAS